MQDLDNRVSFSAYRKSSSLMNGSNVVKPSKGAGGRQVAAAVNPVYGGLPNVTM